MGTLQTLHHNLSMPSTIFVMRLLSPVNELLSARRNVISFLLPYSCFLTYNSFNEDGFFSGTIDDLTDNASSVS